MATLLSELTDQQLTSVRTAAVAKRRENAARLCSNFPLDDQAEWARLAKIAGVKLPPFGVPVTTAAMKRWLSKLGISLAEYYEQEGSGLDGNISSARLDDFTTRNPTWPLKAWVGLMLEYLERHGRIQEIRKGD